MTLPKFRVLFDVMDTVVYDPYRVEMPTWLGMDFEELVARVDPAVWPRFERGEIDESTFFRALIPGGPPIEASHFHAKLLTAYHYLDGMEGLLDDLRGAGVEMHALSNYPSWWELVEEKLALSRFMTWDFVSCRTGFRKPDVRAYLHAIGALGAPPQGVIFVDDRWANCDAASSVGLQALQFVGAPALRASLVELGVFD